MADVTIWHNPSCGSSKNALAYLEEKGVTPRIYKYATEKPTRAEIQAVLDVLGLRPSELLRPKEKAAEEAGLYGPDVAEEVVLDAMAATPKLIQRPIVVTEKGAVIARPKTKIDAIL